MNYKRQQLSLLLLKVWTVVICDYKLRYCCDDGNFEYECPLVNHRTEINPTHSRYKMVIGVPVPTVS